MNAAVGDWTSALTSPASAMFAPLIDRLDTAHFPDCAGLNALLDKQHRNAGGSPIRFVAPGGAGNDEGYEARIFRSGDIVTRQGSWHDLFNALAWLTFPACKRELNRLHFEHASREAGQRGAARDALTAFDESGVLIACADASLARLLADFRWRELFVERRADVVRHMRFLVFGHALQEQMLQPYPGVTGKALVLECDAHVMQAALPAQLRELDQRAAALVASGGALASPRSLSPLPLLGIPGWDAANADPIYYDNTAVFRPGRRGKPVE